MVMIIEVMFDGDSSQSGASSVYGSLMIRRLTTAAGGCGEGRGTLLAACLLQHSEAL
jgi:hypothetical protein